MKKLLLLILPVFLLIPSRVEAASCGYRSTQARVQPNIQTAWAQNIEIFMGQTFRVASFHNGTGVLANDTYLQLTGPGMSTRVFNEGTVVPPQSGDYYVKVTTPGQDGYNCTQTARVKVKPVPASTQARVQDDVSMPWTSRLEDSDCNDWSFRVGSFHNGVDKFAGDVTMTLYGPNQHIEVKENWAKNLYNGKTVNVPKEARFKGWYSLVVKTKNAPEVPACMDLASVRVGC